MDVPEWEEPAAYRFVIDGSCGETPLSGTFEIAVEGGEVVEVTDLGGEHEAPYLSSQTGLTIAELREIVDEARDEGADVLEVEYAEDDPGRPVDIVIDYDENALDDEMCYRISDYVPEV
ncbi:DUF6174 domain-containing protein [Streptomyces sp. 8K308]|uniref:DUF6174 domain-containing protein n=1 Tax=Streptomyces sp. 8K308 TaxID=2530388 RepID=UPI00104AE5D4|nr:DUF6174 domain-containing protein [Streptomyces sp. 8K308]